MRARFDSVRAVPYRPGVPHKTPTRSMRVPNETWDAICAIAERDNRTVTSVVVEALDRFVTTDKRKQRKQEREAQERGEE